MSAFIQSNEHFDVLVSYFASPVRGSGLWTKIGEDWDYLTPENAYKVAEMLNIENLKSVNHRYNEGEQISYEFTYYDLLDMVYTPAEIAKAIDGLEYQSCEHDGWDSSEAKATLGRMRKHLLTKMRGYEDAETWSIDEVKRPTAVRLI